MPYLSIPMFTPLFLLCFSVFPGTRCIMCYALHLALQSKGCEMSHLLSKVCIVIDEVCISFSIAWSFGIVRSGDGFHFDIGHLKYSINIQMYTSDIIPLSCQLSCSPVLSRCCWSTHWPSPSSSSSLASWQQSLRRWGFPTTPHYSYQIV